MDPQAIIDKFINWISNIDIAYMINWVQGLTPTDLVTNKWLLATIALTCLILFLLKALRTLSLIIGGLALWSAKTYFMPDIGVEISLVKLISFAFTCLFVGVLWIYMFFIRGD